MDQEKIGKFIAQCRKEKKLTQEEIGDRFGITSQSVSKWERGVNCPDISVLAELSNMLGVRIEELLKGEKDVNTLSKKEENQQAKDQVIVDTIKFYEKKTKKKCFRISALILTILIIIICLILSMYCISNYNKVKIYKIVSLSEEISLNGRIIFNPNNKILIINNIFYNDIYVGTDKEVKAKQVMLKIESENKTILEYGTLETNEKGPLKHLNEYLEEIDINISEIENNSSLTADDLKDISLKIYYIDENDKEQVIQKELNAINEFSNNSIYYN